METVEAAVMVKTVVTAVMDEMVETVYVETAVAVETVQPDSCDS